MSYINLSSNLVGVDQQFKGNNYTFLITQRLEPKALLYNFN